MTDERINKKEKLLLEYLIADKETFIKCYRILKPSYFDPPLSRVVEFLIEYFQKYGGQPDPDAIDAETDVLLKEREIDDSERDYLLDEIEEHCSQAALREAVLEGADRIEEGRGHELQQLIREALLVKIDKNLGLDLFENPKERIETMDETVEEFSTGIADVDSMIGNVRKRELGLVYAVTSGGKSIFLANMANALASQSLDVFIVNLEMSEELYGKRLDSIISNTNIDNHFTNASNIEAYYETIKEEYGNIIIKRMPAGTPPSKMDALLLEYHLEFGKYPDVFVVDYIGIMGVDGMRGNMNKFDLDEQKAHALIEMGDRYDMSVLSAGQINRDGYDITNLNPAHCAGGLSLVNSSAWSIGLVATEEDLDNDLVQVVPMKIRMAKKQSKSVTLFKNPDTLRFSTAASVSSNANKVTEKLTKKTAEAKKGTKEDNETKKQKLKRAINLSN